ncbi:putative secreted protein (Por secretion system target) [Ulvibacter sp. MAR_2010_11]|uniref:M14 family zinc carboxypeptidase n=1 Tax=Ulvibacter sp. MAR_2010_11 TaxID=1250229 RepID=UPI000C2C81D6|nr:M14 family zinc carboxypeptidase [Ulvibacter sp. MAR_2010_11]PKA83895.1 putative secreted protein (Por secretion system target) [Ulvibacter sp. MAR_2010_11]
MKKLALLLLLISAVSFSQNIQEKHQRAQINYNSTNDLTRLNALGIPLEHGVHKKGHFIISDFSVSEINLARQAGFSVEILIEDSKAYFLQQNQLNNPPQRNLTCDGSGATEYQTPANFQLGSMGGYLTYQELLDELDEMAALFPNLITQKDNISTFLTEGTPDNSTTPPIGGNGIKWVKISDNPNASEGEPQILYTALHHAREPAGLSQLVFYMWYLLENYATDPEIQSIVDNTELFFVPVLNPDGYLYNQKTDPNGGGFWRKNRKNTYGTDLNRNYDYYINGDPGNGTWGGEGTSSDTESQVYHGPAPFSEIETQAIKWFVEQHDFVMAINNHTSGDLLLYPYGYTDNAPTPENALFEGISEELVSQNGFDNIISSELYPAAGVSDDFMYGTVGTHDKIYSMTPEIGPSFWPPSNQIVPISQGMMYLNLTSAKMVNNYAAIKDTAPLFVGSLVNAEADFDIKRLGVSGTGNFTVSMNPISANISTVGNAVTFTGMDVLDTDSGFIPYTLANGTVEGDAIIYELIVNNGSYDSKITINKLAGSLLPVFNDPGNSVSDNFVNVGWGITTNTFVSPSSSITDSPGALYPPNSNKTITLSNSVDLTNALGASASFYAKWDLEPNYDYVQFEVSINGGSTWIPQCGKYTNAGSNNNSQPTGEPLYDGSQSDWVLEEINLSDYLGETILVRFQFRSDNGDQRDGFYFDDLKINIASDGTLGAPETTENHFELFPNPIEDVLHINTQLTNYSISMYTLQGQLVTKTENNSGPQSFDYSNYASGVYMIQITSENASKTFKVVKL